MNARGAEGEAAESVEPSWWCLSPNFVDPKALVRVDRFQITEAQAWMRRNSLLKCAWSQSPMATARSTPFNASANKASRACNKVSSARPATHSCRKGCPAQSLMRGW
jgi:hypothetical protein